jgi:predicted HNH restriction endonuclease
MVPLGARKRAGRTRLAELVLICANCHSMVHYLNPTPPLKNLVRRPSREA